MQIIKEFTDTDNIRIRLFLDDNNRYRIWIYDIEKPGEKLEQPYPSLEKAMADYNTYMEGIE